jgi:HrpA-like RNA helicase
MVMMRVSARQRIMRCGRLGDLICYRSWRKGYVFIHMRASL